MESRMASATESETAASISRADRPELSATKSFTIEDEHSSLPLPAEQSPRALCKYCFFMFRVGSRHSISCEKQILTLACISVMESVVATITTLCSPVGLCPLPLSLEFSSLTLPCLMLLFRQLLSSLSALDWPGILENAWNFLKSRIHGAKPSALSNAALITDAVSASELCTRSKEFRSITCTPIAPATSSTALALLHPAGPWSSTEVRGDRESLQ
mmetsp:Transcript_952/g.2210  ORF Transcript_952/g.2210 Transcript_952/m.2210 type:complete len:216 (-) Transcript_952:97-744(-)